MGKLNSLSKLARPNAAIITNIGEAHLMDLGSREAIAEAKLEIVTGLQEGGVFVYNGDEPLLTNRVPEMNLIAETVTFGDARANDYYPTTVTLQATGTHFKMNREENISFYLPVLGKHNVYNTLCFYGNCETLWCNVGRDERRFSNTSNDRHAYGNCKTNSGLTIINDAYNASPTAMEAAFHLMNGLDGFSKKLLFLVIC